MKRLVFAALNTVLWFAIPPYEKPLDSGTFLARKRYISFFENAVVISGMQQSSGIFAMFLADFGI